ncbi:16S rRNA (cytosine(1402)-N(4))-methyltransferase RsmH [Mycobacteroides franklinii]|uniref:Ribosomal RNA small subunit methyltransferase H n=1 Tax=Mycobacteroides franklinii TaxID=948102 RepID=F8SQ18_9MYCO|nr:16S rRNA (cytosine(1402)-N(4))-methyltransferase RsmH [Mycobacteroides franklinii]AEI54942.1 S-adenosyl-methyltransferase [Mycobacteroides franklinii]ORA58855.1 16S rRNA (cytosine(1402)-N(4))-methyltransferase [Mycobacteroides franklinii]TDH21114.1 16S rRNA (cytosine(1402)-N(4))-methyltransferase RsmH [Mycobacteroides franklinii]TDZ42550.1 Ribosomal RNA small subunit methyltransferase H [Mycobacteroides franklinii]TDZ52698.1 Ribosomal RNA small subunit methyltransferase H [Mycobacteroides f
MSDNDSRFGHIPVMRDRCYELLAPALTVSSADGSGAVLVDATLGAGGHTEYFLTMLPGLTVVGLDRDTNALDIARARLAHFGSRFIGVHTRYDGMADALDGLGYRATSSVDAVLFDLGVSSMQLDQAERGFAYSVDAPLDMRMNAQDELTAADILNTYSAVELSRVLSRYGEERFARRIADEIVRRRDAEPFTRSGQLVELLYATIPAATRRTGGHPAKRTFQALRIAVNAELESLAGAIPTAMAALRPGGRVAVMAYQSLEDKIVKAEFTAATASRSPIDLPVELPSDAPEFRAITRGAERADEAEIEVNPRSAPVRLRAVERVGDRRKS